MENSKFVNCKQTNYNFGAAITVQTQSATLRDNIFINNTVKSNGGAVAGSIYGGDLIIDNCTFIGNQGSVFSKMYFFFFWGFFFSIIKPHTHTHTHRHRNK